jgi:phage terminase large subunit-like protein
MPTKKTQTTASSTDRTTDYARAVLAGQIIAGPHVRNSCRRHLNDLISGAARGIHFDAAAAKRAFDFFEGVLKLSEGQFEGKPLRLDPSQAFIIGSLFGWKRISDGTRRFRRGYVEQGKGNGKSPLAGGIGLYGMTADDEGGAQIYAAAAKKEQAAILFQDACKMVRKSPALNKRLAFSGGLGREFNIAHHSSGSFFRPISKDAGKTGSGPRPHFALCDEVHEHPDRTIMEMLERGFKFRRQPLLFMITNSGSDRNSICWEEHQHAVRVAAGTATPDEDFTYVGEILDDTTFSYVCALDRDEDPLEDPRCWPKANPLLGVTITEEYLAGVVKQAKQLPGKLNGILRLHFCQWTDASTAWMGRQALEACLDDFDPEEHAGADVHAGGDLSGSQDLTALAFVVPTGMVERKAEDGTTKLLPTFDAWVEAWTPGDTLQERALRDQAPYDVWVADGWLNAPEGKQIRLDFVAARLAEAAIEYRIREFAYDRYAYRKLEDELDALGVDIRQVEHPQGGKRRAKVPDEDAEAARREGREVPQGLWMPGSLAALEELILDRRIRLRRSPVLISACMSAVTEADPFDNRWFSKRKATNRIDAVVALAMAVGSAVAATSRVAARSFWDAEELEEA